jgi:hypothetical protein
VGASFAGRINSRQQKHQDRLRGLAKRSIALSGDVLSARVCQHANRRRGIVGYVDVSIRDGDAAAAFALFANRQERDPRERIQFQKGQTIHLQHRAQAIRFGRGGARWTRNGEWENEREENEDKKSLYHWLRALQT